MNLLELIKAGRAHESAEQATNEVAKAGTLRGGSVGAIINGEHFGKCARLSALRARGLSINADASRIPMFSAGRSNEDIITAELARVWEDGPILREEEIPINWQLPDGTPVSGRPDIVLCGGSASEPDPRFGIEAKLVSSIWTAIAVNFDLRPRSEHLIQAAHYSWQLGFLPYSLYYSSRAEYHLSTAPKWLQDKFQPGTPDVEFKEDKRKSKGGATPFKITPFDRVYDLTWSGHPDPAQRVLSYHTPGMDVPQQTTLTPAAIQAYYQHVSSLGSDGTAGPRPSAQSIDGSKSYNPCDYCELAGICDMYEDKFDVWLDASRLAIESLNKEKAK
jgi:hypothetical protein